MMQLIYAMQENGWFLGSNDTWYPINDDKGVEVALGTLRLQAINEFDLAEQPVQTGYAHLEQNESDEVQISLFSTEGDLLEQESLTLNAEILASVDWQAPPHPDGWVDAAVRVLTENVKKLTVKIFIPPMDESEGKSLTVENCATGESRDVLVKRGEENSIVIFEQESAEKQEYRLICDAEVTNDSSDVRSLGFVLLDKAIIV